MNHRTPILRLLRHWEVFRYWDWSYLHAIVTVALSCINSEIKRDIGWKSQFFIPPAFDATAGGLP